MTFSPLISGTVPNNGKYSSRQGRSVAKVVQHHWAGTGGGIERMSGPDQASTTYLILTDGRILGHVPEEFRPWTSGSFEADSDAITIEVQNTGGQVNGNDSDPSSWPISAAAHNSIIELLADVAQRYGWGGISDSNYRGHREFSSTACPGGYLWNRMADTRAAAQALFSGGGISLASSGTTPTQSEEDDMPSLQEIFDYQLTAPDGSTMTLGEMVAESRVGRSNVEEAVKGVPAKVLSFPFTRIGTDGKPNGETTLRDVVGAAEANVTISRALATASPQEISDSIPEAIVAKVAELLSERLAG
jgi:hypothetical protein